MKNDKFKDLTKILPSCTILLCLPALGLIGFSSIMIELQYDRTAILQGEIWRLITGHWTHFPGDHLLWCVLVFAVMGIPIV